MSETCGFVAAWIGPCGLPMPCEKHSRVKCCVCGEPATRECDQTMGLVCGFLLCDGCDHETAEDGTNGGTFGHVKKADQEYLPWYARPKVDEEGGPG